MVVKESMDETAQFKQACSGTLFSVIVANPLNYLADVRTCADRQ